MSVVVRVVLGVAGLVSGGLAVVALREATLSTHHRVDPPARDDVVLTARSERAERGQSLAELVEALVITCRLEVTSDVEVPVESLGEDRFRVVLAPALDETNRRQFRGCVEDWTIDQVRADVVSITAVG